MLLHDLAIVPAKRNVGLLKCGARRRHSRCPLSPEREFGISVKGSFGQNTSLGVAVEEQKKRWDRMSL